MSKGAIVTGASAGIGAATATLLVDQGYAVVNVARRPAPDSRVQNVLADLAKPLSGTNLADLATVCEQHNQVALVHCAGLLTSDSATDVDRATLQHALAINVVAPAGLNAALIPRMNRGSSIIFVGSTLGDKAVAGAYSYVACKHAVNGLMRATCQDLAGRDIHTAVVSPGFTDTQMLREHVGHDAKILTSIAAGVTFNRLATPVEIAETIAFCARSPVINGSVIHANLGLIA